MPILIFSTFVVFVVVQLLPSCALLWQLFSNLRWWLECQEAGSSEQLWLWGCDQDAKCYCQVIFKSTFWWPGSWAFCPTCVPCSYRFLQLFFLAAVDSEVLQLAYVFHLSCSLERKKFYLLSQLWEYLYMFPSALCSVKAVEWPLERLWTCWHSCQSCT